MSPLEVLSLKHGDSLLDAKRQYRSLSVRYHPDKNPDNPHALEMFRVVQDSYLAIKKNPDLLSLKTPIFKPKGTCGYLLLEVPVDTSDVYFKIEKSIKVQRKVLCKGCGGSGSSLGSAGICELCQGHKKVRNKVSSLIGLNAACPACKGTGTKDAPCCSVCSGTGFTVERVPINFCIDEKQFSNNLVVLKNVGDESLEGVKGDVHVRLKRDYRSRVTLQGGDYRCSYFISPAQYAVGDQATINLLGRELSFEIPKNGTESIIKMKGFKDIYIDLIILTPEGNSDSERLYREIIAIERSIGGPYEDAI